MEGGAITEAIEIVFVSNRFWIIGVYGMKFLRSSLRLILLTLVFLSVLGSDLYARENYAKHRIDYYAVLGIDRGSNSSLEPLFARLNDIIDQEGGNSKFIKELKDKFGLSFGGGKKHRYLFHWGFNQDIRKFKTLRNVLEEEFSKIVRNELAGDENQMDGRSVDEIVEERVGEALEFIHKKRNEINRELIQLCMQITGLPRNESAGLITILWDVHILADYTGKELEGLLPFPEVSIDLKEKGIRRLFEQDIRQSSEFEQMVKGVFKQLEGVYSSGSCGYLNVLCGYSDCVAQVEAGEGAIAQLLKQSKIIRGILEKNGIVFAPSH